MESRDGVADPLLLNSHRREAKHHAWIHCPSPSRANETHRARNPTCQGPRHLRFIGRWAHRFGLQAERPIVHGRRCLSPFCRKGSP